MKPAPEKSGPVSVGASKRSTYRHGDLRSAMITRGIEILETEGLAALSIRRVARDLHVSPTAPLHHFENLAAYHAAVAAQGFRQLYEKRIAMLRKGRDPAERLLMVLLAKLQFAIEHGALFQVMYGPAVPNKMLQPELEGAANRSYGLMESCVREYLADRNVSAERVEAAIFAAWATCHGVATIMADRRNAWDVIGRKDPMTSGREVFTILIAGFDHT
jgi:AcrR family transcriptional regulator